MHSTAAVGLQHVCQPNCLDLCTRNTLNAVHGGHDSSVLLEHFVASSSIHLGSCPFQRTEVTVNSTQ